MRKEKNSGKEIPAQHLENMAEVLKVLAHPVRLRIVEVLDNYGEQAVNSIVAKLGEGQGTVSGHLNRMRRSGIIRASRRGKEMWYGLADRDALTILCCIRKKLCNREKTGK